jgi:hypothetical protein
VSGGRPSCSAERAQPNQRQPAVSRPAVWNSDDDDRRPEPQPPYVHALGVWHGLRGE